MSLRLKLAIGAAVMSAVVVISVAVAGYWSTSATVNNGDKTSVVNLLSRFEDPDGHLVASLCARPSDATDRYDRVDAGLLGGAPGITLQCRDQSGKLITSLGPPVSTDLKRVSCQSPSGIHTEEIGDDKYLVGVTNANGMCIAAVRNLSETHETLNIIRNRFIALGIIATALAAIAGLFAARRATAPILHLTSVAERITETAEIEMPIAASGNDEVGRLSRAFSSMLDSLRRAREQQQQFVQDAGHELRTPLTSMRTNVDTLARYSDLDKETRERIIADIRSELGEMTSLIQELVVLGNENDDEPVQSVDLGAIATDVVDKWQRRTNRTIELSVSNAAVINGQPLRIGRALSNLVDNALKFSPEPGIVKVLVVRNTIEVRDSGAGFDEADSARLFDRFYRSASARSQPGSGLGLAIVQDVAKDHNGIASARNHEDGGAVFSLELPGTSLD